MSNRKEKKDYTGMRFGTLTAVNRVQIPKDEKRMRTAWECRCDCGKELVVRSDKLPRRKTCGDPVGHRLRMRSRTEHICDEAISRLCRAVLYQAAADYHRLSDSGASSDTECGLTYGIEEIGEFLGSAYGKAMVRCAVDSPDFEAYVDSVSLAPVSVRDAAVM